MPLDDRPVLTSDAPRDLAPITPDELRDALDALIAEGTDRALIAAAQARGAAVADHLYAAR